MGALGRHLVANVPALLSENDSELWAKIHPLIDSSGLEAALLKQAPTSSLESVIVQHSGNFIAAAESEIISEVFGNTRKLRLTKLLPHLITHEAGIPIITTNYDRLVEIACEEAGLGVDTLFSGNFAARLAPLDSMWSFCREARLTGKRVRYRWAPKANVFKPHGSLDWYHREGSPVRYAGTLPLPRLIITPGINKFRNGYESPFDKHREKANDAIDRARRLLIIGYGFNDDHLETHLTPQIVSGVKTLMLTQALSEKAKRISIDHKNVISVEYCNRDGIEGSNVIADGEQVFFPGIHYWDLGKFVEGVLST